MHGSTCRFAAALFGLIGGCVVGAAFGVFSGWLLYASYVPPCGRHADPFALLAFGTLGMSVGGSGGATGGMIGGWGLAGAGGTARASAARWGAVVGGFWSLQPILWLVLTTRLPSALACGVGVAAVVTALGAASGSLGSLAARSVIGFLGSDRVASFPLSRRFR